MKSDQLLASYHPTQCKVAKVTCEKRIHDITRLQKRAPHYADMRFKEAETKLLELDEILYSPYVLPFFVQVLDYWDCCIEHYCVSCGVKSC